MAVKTSASKPSWFGVGGVARAGVGAVDRDRRVERVGGGIDRVGERDRAGGALQRQAVARRPAVALVGHDADLRAHGAAGRRPEAAQRDGHARAAGADLLQAVEHGQVARGRGAVAVRHHQGPARELPVAATRARLHVGHHVLARAGRAHDVRHVEEALVGLARRVRPAAWRGPCGSRRHPGARRSTVSLAAGFGAGAPPAPAASRPPQYRPANRTRPSAGSVSCAPLDENVAGSASTST